MPRAAQDGTDVKKGFVPGKVTRQPTAERCYDIGRIAQSQAIIASFDECRFRIKSIEFGSIWSLTGP
jgi:hypothetical protein